MRAFAEAGWYGKDWRWWLLWPLLAPLSLVFIVLAWLNARRGRAQASALSKPVLVVGNITVGGTGKTPLMVCLVKALQARGWKPAIISRGYGGQPPHLPFEVTSESPVQAAGDEPLMLAQATGVPVVVDPDRQRAAQYLCNQSDCDLILSDDGLQHYRLGRSAEICVLDASRGLGNGWRLPFGPLREAPDRLQTVDWVLVNGESQLLFVAGAEVMQVRPKTLVNLATGETRPVSELAEGRWQAVCGIGNPARFFSTLESLHCDFESWEFPDHHQFTATDFLSGESAGPVVMTEKDAVKCRHFAQPQWWYLAIEAEVSNTWLDAVSHRLRQSI